MSNEQAARLAGEWVSFHETKRARSTLGGRILGFEQGTGDMADRKVILLGFEHAGRRQAWRGANHGMAMCGGIGEADLPLEVR